MPSLWNDATTPATTPTQGGGITTGTWMFADVDIWITRFRYYRGSQFSVGPHRGLIYAQGGSILAQKVYASEATGTGWRLQALDTALKINANTPFLVAIFSGAGDYVGTSGVFASQLNAAPLHGYASSASPGGGNGVFATGGSPTYPTSTFNNTAYFADIVYQTTAPNVTPVANAGANQTVASKATVTLDGSASTDADGTIASYAWRQISGYTVTLSSATVVKPTFTAPLVQDNTMLTFGLTVTDNGGASSLEKTTSVFVQPPTTSTYQLQNGTLKAVKQYQLNNGQLT